MLPSSPSSTTQRRVRSTSPRRLPSSRPPPLRSTTRHHRWTEAQPSGLAHRARVRARRARAAARARQTAWS
eukprot:7790688-Alexandrium_andersonii.AAC.1